MGTDELHLGAFGSWKLARPLDKAVHSFIRSSRTLCGSSPRRVHSQSTSRLAFSWLILLAQVAKGREMFSGCVPNGFVEGSTRGGRGKRKEVGGPTLDHHYVCVFLIFPLPTCSFMFFVLFVILARLCCASIQLSCLAGLRLHRDDRIRLKIVFRTKIQICESEPKCFRRLQEASGGF